MGGGLENHLPALGMVVIQFIYAGMTLLTRKALLYGMSPRVFIVYRHILATIVIGPIAYFSGRNSGSYRLNFRSFSLIFLTTLFGITLNQNLYFEGLYLASSSIASAMSNMVPAVTFVVTAFVGMEKVNIRSPRSIAKIVGTVICVSGAVSMVLLKGPKLLNMNMNGEEENNDVLPSKSLLKGPSESVNWLLGCLCLFGACTAWSLWFILQVPASASHPDHLSFSAWMCFMATFQTAIVTFFLERDPDAWKIHSPLEFGCTLYAGVMGSAVIFFVQAWCVSKRGPLFCTTFVPLFTVIVTILAALLLHEQIYVGSLIGTIGVIIGLYTVLWGKAQDIIIINNVKVVESSTTDPKSMLVSPPTTTEEAVVKILVSTNDLEEPLLSAKSSPSNYY